MGKINYGRVVLGGLVAGVIINIGEFILNEQILKTDWADAMKALNKPVMSGSAIPILVVLCMFLGIFLTWVYAAIRPRFSAGPKTAICAGLVVWTLAYAWPSLSGMVMEMFPAKLFVISMIWGLFEAPIAALAGASLYKET
ncbi:MAG: hypothetical protein LAP85_08385 [Acidobacteriia bacterium]|nr:hypothetical protein [Terriglobia bacterium]